MSNKQEHDDMEMVDPRSHTKQGRTDRDEKRQQRCGRVCTRKESAFHTAVFIHTKCMT